MFGDDDTPKMSDLPALVVPGRTCGTCTVCCRILAVEELNKPRSTWCVHCIPQKGCGIHPSRPQVCREFVCNWLLLESLGPEWKPERSKFVLQSVAYQGGHQCLAVHVDPDHPESWRQPPFYEKIKQWAAKASERATGGIYFVLVQIDLRKILILPDREIDLGTFANKEAITLDRRVSASAIEFVARKIPRGAST
jgi:hypothetical protein